MNRLVLVSLGLAGFFGSPSHGQAAKEQMPDVPGCELVAQLGSCLEAASNTPTLNACFATARDEAAHVLRNVRVEVKASLLEEAATLAAIERADAAWESFAVADCDAVAAAWSGGSLASGQVAACQFHHVLSRAQALWSRHLAAEEAVPVECRP